MALETPTKRRIGNTRRCNVEGVFTPEPSGMDSTMSCHSASGAASSGSQWSSPKRKPPWADVGDSEEECGGDQVDMQCQQNLQEQESHGKESGSMPTDALAAAAPFSQLVCAELERQVTNDGFDDGGLHPSMDGPYSPMVLAHTMTSFPMAVPWPTAHLADSTQQQQQQLQQLLQWQQLHQQPLPHKMLESMLRAELGHNGVPDITMSESEEVLPLFVSWSFLRADLESTDKQITKNITLHNFGPHAIIKLMVLIKAKPAYLAKGGDRLKKSKGIVSIQFKLLSDAFLAADTSMTFRLAALVAGSKPAEMRGPFEGKFDGVLAPKAWECPEGEWWHLKGDRQRVTLCMEIQKMTDN